MSTVLGLEQVRRCKGVSLQQISDSTKISPFFLRAIESEEFEKLPGGVFDTNYIRQYAAEIGFAQDKLLAHYRSQMEERERERNRVQPVNPSKSWGLRLLDWLKAPSFRNS
jgi:cytoskeletal protein RodZ